MDKVERSLQWQIAAIGFVVAILGALIGGVATLIGAYWALDQQQKTLDEQENEDLHNIATALYIDVSNIEEILNYSMSMLPYYTNNTSLSNHPIFYLGTGTQYYDVNWLFHNFAKDISKFKFGVFRDIYIFYDNVMEIENQRQFVCRVFEKSMRSEQISSYELSKAHEYNNSLFRTRIPFVIEQAEKIKKELKQEYENL